MIGSRSSSAACVVGCLAACGGDDPSFTLVTHDEPAALLSAWGASASDVWVVGGAANASASPAVLHFDGTAWSRVDSGQLGIDLWWVFGFVGGDVFASGTAGTILRGHDGVFEPMVTPAAQGTVFGMWGASAEDLWAVGRIGTAGGALLWHFDGITWTTIDAPNLPATDIAFKVSGRASNDVWISCSGGGTLHWTGAPPFEYMPIDDPASLFSIVTTPSDIVTAGGVTQLGTGALYENAGGGWAPASLAAPVAWHGVGGGTEHVYVVGDGGVIASRDAAGTWAVLDQSLTHLPFHAAWVDDDDGFWGVGGNFDTQQTTSGFLLYRGRLHPPAL